MSRKFQRKKFKKKIKKLIKRIVCHDEIKIIRNFIRNEFAAAILLFIIKGKMHGFQNAEFRSAHLSIILTVNEISEF